MATKRQLLEGAAGVAQALGNAGRLELLELLAQRDFTVTELSETADMNVKTASAHLRVLKEAGLVAASRDGTSVAYTLSGAPAATVLSELYSATFALSATTRELHARSVPQGARLLEIDDLRTLAPHTLVDTRPASEFAAGHLENSVNIAVEDLPSHLASVPADHLVVVYCRGPFCLLAHRAAAMIAESGRPVAIVNAGGVGIRARTGHAG
jgi:DNA-binding transcriptional ArsR family regulator